MLHNKGTSCFYKERIKGTEKEGVLCNFSPDVDVDMTIDRVQRCWNRITVIGTKLNKVIAERVQSWNRDWENAEQFSEDLEI